MERPVYLNELIRSKGNGSIKIITGIRRCGKSYLLKILFRDHKRKPAEFSAGFLWCREESN